MGFGGDVEISDDLEQVAEEYQLAIEAAVHDWTHSTGYDPDAILDAADAVLIHDTVVESGRSIRDGDLDEVVPDEAAQAEFVGYLKGRLRDFADYTGAGRFEEALMAAVVGDDDDFEEEDE